MITTSRTRFGLGRIYLSATSEARRRGDRRVGTEHLLLAVLVDADSVPARAFGVSSTTAHDALQTMDDIALASLGIIVGGPRFDPVAPRPHIGTAMQSVGPNRLAPRR